MIKLLLPMLSTQILTISLVYAYSPYAPQGLGSTSEATDIAAYEYDTAGNRLTGSFEDNDYTIAYGLIGKPVSINIPNVGTETLSYGLGGRRYLRVNAGGVKTLYIGDREYQIPANEGSPKSIVYIRKGAYSPVAQVDTSSSTPSYKFYLRDYQGTPLVAVGNDGNLEDITRYDSWGVPVNATGAALAQSEIVDGSRGFTGHEIMKTVGFYHANGRLLDELTGFISPDPVVLSSNLVSLNRYAYTLNSPTNYVDISGYAPWPSPEHLNEFNQLRRRYRVSNREALARSIFHDQNYPRGPFADQLHLEHRNSLVNPPVPAAAARPAAAAAMPVAAARPAAEAAVADSKPAARPRKRRRVTFNLPEAAEPPVAAPPVAAAAPVAPVAAAAPAAESAVVVWPADWMTLRAEFFPAEYHQRAEGIMAMMRQQIISIDDGVEQIRALRQEYPEAVLNAEAAADAAAAARENAATGGPFRHDLFLPGGGQHPSP